MGLMEQRKMMVKRLVYLAIVLGCYISYSQNVNYIFPNFDKSGMESDILYNPANTSRIIQNITFHT
jgi:hypothetical protein